MARTWPTVTLRSSRPLSVSLLVCQRSHLLRILRRRRRFNCRRSKSGGLPMLWLHFTKNSGLSVTATAIRQRRSSLTAKQQSLAVAYVQYRVRQIGCVWILWSKSFGLLRHRQGKYVLMWLFKKIYLYHWPINVHIPKMFCLLKRHKITILPI